MSAEPPRRAYYMTCVQEALLALGGEAETQQVYDWLRENGRAKAEDLQVRLKSGDLRFEKEVRFARMMLERAGFVDRPQTGVWRLTEAGRRADLSGTRANDVLRALHAVKGGLLNAERTYAAILAAARERRFVSYGELGEASGVAWAKARLPLPMLLGRISQLAHARGWPMLSAIVVNREDIETGRFGENALKGFIGAARDIGVDVGEDLEAFVRAEQARVFAWAPTAPDHMGLAGRGDGAADPEDAELEAEVFLTPPPSVAAVSDRAARVAPTLDPPRRRYWFAGAAWSGYDDQTERFLDQGIWQIGYQDEASTAQIRKAAAGDRIAIKAAFVRKRNLPFDVGGATVSAMRIKATGTILANPGDGVTLEVAWDPPAPPRDWYFYTYMKTLHEADPEDERARQLIDFTFHGAAQDYGWWLSQPYFVRKYGQARPIESVEDKEDQELGPEPAIAAPYAAADIIDDGCFLPLADLEDILQRLRSRKNLILQGPPGTGKTWLAKRLAYALLGTRDGAGDRLRVVQFHPSLAYEDFVRGWRPGSDGKLHLADGVFLQAIEAALSEPDRPFVLVIEEINRGDPAQVLGEMLTLLEASKRRPDEALELAYPRPRPGGEKVYIPENLHVVGTMNVADRSLALVDLALRRRFAFVSLEPRLGEAWRRCAREVGGLAPATAALIEERIGLLNQDIAADRGLGPQFRIGHSYVTPIDHVGGEDGGVGWFRSVVETEILPLLDEYWHDQPDRATEAAARLVADLS